jgi:probable rRNA maturation factor
MTMASPTIDVQVACDDSDVPPQSDIHEWVQVSVQQSGRAPDDDFEIDVRIVDADEIRTLNKLYREQDKVTNVLTFPAGEIAGLSDDTPRLLGDVVVCASVVAREAIEQGKPLRDHWGHMLVHGTLHLLGFDHETDNEAAAMEGLESEILASQNVTDPYVES